MTKVAVIGAGNWGRNHVQTFYELNSLEAVVEPNQELQRTLKEEYENLTIYNEVDDVIHTDIAAIVIATPAPTHFSIAKKALLAGKDVLIEKPMTLTSEEGEKLVSIAKKKKCILMVGHLLLYQPAIQFMKNYIASGKLGEIATIKQQRTKLGKVRAVEDVLWSFGVHDIAVLLYLTGKKPNNVNVIGQQIIQEGIADDVYLHVSFPNNLFAHLNVSWLYPEDIRKLVIVGSKGMLVYDESDHSVILHQKSITKNLQHVDRGKKLLFIGDKNPLKLECSHFLTSVKERKNPISDGLNGVEVIRILESAEKQMKGDNPNV